jgi:hypothetical protein
MQNKSGNWCVEGYTASRYKCPLSGTKRPLSVQKDRLFTLDV